jgi:hypothetical protein
VSRQRSTDENRAAARDEQDLHLIAGDLELLPTADEGNGWHAVAARTARGARTAE